VNLTEIEKKIESISLGFEVGNISREGDGWLYQRLENRGEDDGEYETLSLSSPLQTELINLWLLTDPDGQPDIVVHGSISDDELRWWLGPILKKWGDDGVWVNGEQIWV
jgi:hypothetical protein